MDDEFNFALLEETIAIFDQFVFAFSQRFANIRKGDRPSCHHRQDRVFEVVGYWLMLDFIEFCNDFGRFAEKFSNFLQFLGTQRESSFFCGRADNSVELDLVGIYLGDGFFEFFYMSWGIVYAFDKKNLQPDFSAEFLAKNFQTFKNLSDLER